MRIVNHETAQSRGNNFGTSDSPRLDKKEQPTENVNRSKRKDLPMRKSMR